MSDVDTVREAEILLKQADEKMTEVSMEVESLMKKAAEKFTEAGHHSRAWMTWSDLGRAIHNTAKYSAQMEHSMMLSECLVNGVIDTRLQAQWFMAAGYIEKAVEMLGQFHDDDSLVALALCKIFLGHDDIPVPLKKESQEFVNTFKHLYEKDDLHLFNKFLQDDKSFHHHWPFFDHITRLNASKWHKH